MAALDNITTVIITVITVLFSASAWKFYETKIKMKKMIKTCIEMI